MKIFFTHVFTISLLTSHVLGMSNQEAVNLLRNASNADQAVSFDYAKYRTAHSVAKKINKNDWRLYWKGKNPGDLFGKLNYFEKALNSYEQSFKKNNQYNGFGYQPNNYQQNTQNYGNFNTLANQFQNLNLGRNQSPSKTLY